MTREPLPDLIDFSRESVEAFFSHWNLYQKVIDHNYMIHNDIVRCFKQCYAYDGPTLSILDIGCGDAYLISQVFDELPLRHYTGIDLSEVALAFAHESIGGGIDSRYLSMDMLAGLTIIEQNFDIVIAGYSIHHLSHEQKIHCLQLIRSRLHAGGRCFIYDMVRLNDETREQYIARYIKVCDQWSNMDDDEIAAIKNHVTGYDYPEDEEFYPTQSLIAGFASVELMHRDPNNFYSIYRLVA